MVTEVKELIIRTALSRGRQQLTRHPPRAGEAAVRATWPCPAARECHLCVSVLADALHTCPRMCDVSRPPPTTHGTRKGCRVEMARGGWQHGEGRVLGVIVRPGARRHSVCGYRLGTHPSMAPATSVVRDAGVWRGRQGWPLLSEAWPHPRGRGDPLCGNPVPSPVPSARLPSEPLTAS